MSAAIYYLQRKEIDDARWNACVERSPGGIIYGYTFYLDHIAENWDGIVMGEYEAVMPLPWKKKWGIKYLYDIPFIQRIGIYSNNIDQQHSGFSGADRCSINMNVAAGDCFVTHIKKRFRFIDANFDLSVKIPGAVLHKKTNYIVPLNLSYEKIRQRYTEECNDNIRKAAARNCSFAEQVAIKEVVELYRKIYGHYHHYNNRDYIRLEALAAEALQRGQLESCGIKNAQNGELLFGALIFTCSKRLYYLAAAPTEEGRKARAAYYFIDRLLQKHAGSSRLFDFEGSDIPDVAAFYKRFGPDSEHYYHVRDNRLPWPFGLLKK